MAPSVVWQADSGYEAARISRLWSKRIPDRYPLGVIKASHEADVVQAVKLAAEIGCRVAVRSGGHSWAAASVRDQSLLVDLENLRGIEYDDETGVVVVSASTTSAQLTDFLLPKRRMFAGGHCPDVAMGGFLLQGGIGWNARGWGWACEQVLAIDVVTASGDILRADATQNSELYWAARGCGPGFPGIVIRFHLQTRVAPTAIHTSAYIYPLSAYETAFSWMLELAPKIDHDTELIFITTQSAVSPTPCLAAIFTTFKATAQEAHAALLPAESSFPPNTVEHTFNQPTTLAAEYTKQVRLNPSGYRYFIDSAFLASTNSPKDLVPLLKPALTNLPSPETSVFWYHMLRPHAPNQVLSLKAEHYLALYAICREESGDEACETYVRGVIERLKGHSVGAYLGDIDLLERTTRFWGEEEGRRLMEVRRKWDLEGRMVGYLAEANDEKGVMEKGKGVGELDNKL